MIDQSRIMAVPRTEPYRVPPVYQAKIEEGIKQAAADWKVTLGDDVSYFWRSKVNRTGNRAIRPKTKGTYENHYKQLWYFFSIVGAYDSMLLLIEPKPAGVPAMEMAYLQAFLRFKRQPKGTPLTFDSGDVDGLPIMNVLGEQVLCEGTWNDPTKAQQCTSALSVLHGARGHEASYMERCALCANLNMIVLAILCPATSTQVRGPISSAGEILPWVRTTKTQRKGF